MADGGDVGDILGPLRGGCGGAERIAIVTNAGGRIVNDGVIRVTSGSLGASFCNPASVVNVVEFFTDPNIGRLPPLRSEVPLPAGAALLIAALAGVGAAARRRPRFHLSDRRSA